MTPKEIAEKAMAQRQEYVKLANKPITMGNYKEMMTQYQRIILRLFDAVIPLALAVDALSPQEVTESKSLAKEKD